LPAPTNPAAAQIPECYIERRKEMETKQHELFETDSEESKEIPFASEIKDKEYYETKIAEENYYKRRIERGLKTGELCYKKDAEKAVSEILDAMLLFFQSFEEVIPFEAFGKTIEESKEIHSAAIAQSKEKMLAVLEKFTTKIEINHV